MNKKRRNEIKKAIQELEELVNSIESQKIKEIDEIHDEIEYVKSDIESIAFDEEMAYDNIPDSLKESDRGYEMEENIEILDTAVSELETLLEEESINEIEINLKSIINDLNNINWEPLKSWTREWKIKQFFIEKSNPYDNKIYRIIGGFFIWTI